MARVIRFNSEKKVVDPDYQIVDPDYQIVDPEYQIVNPNDQGQGPGLGTALWSIFHFVLELG